MSEREVSVNIKELKSHFDYIVNMKIRWFLTV